LTCEAQCLEKAADILRERVWHAVNYAYSPKQAVTYFIEWADKPETENKEEYLPGYR
jgi:hypothetical protein